MDSFNIEVMLKDGSVADYEVNSSSNDNYEILKEGKHLISFKANNNGKWTSFDNSGGIDEDLQERITNQLNGFRR